MRIMDQVIDTGSIEGGGAPLNAMDEVALRQKQLRKVGAILSGDAGDERHLSSRVSHIAPPNKLAVRMGARRGRRDVPTCRE